MGDTYRDPVDHLRTTRPNAGRAVIDAVGWPGYLLVVVGVIATVGCLAAFGTGHHQQGVTAAWVAGVATALGVLWLTVEHRRIRGITDRWNVSHPETRHPRH